MEKLKCPCYMEYSKLNQEENTLMQFLRNVLKPKVQRNPHNDYSCYFIFFVVFPPRSYRCFFPLSCFLPPGDNFYLFILKEINFMYLSWFWGFYIEKTIVVFSEVNSIFPWQDLIIEFTILYCLPSIFTNRLGTWFIFTPSTVPGTKAVVLWILW